MTYLVQALSAGRRLSEFPWRSQHGSAPAVLDWIKWCEGVLVETGEIPENTLTSCPECGRV